MFPSTRLTIIHCYHAARTHSAQDATQLSSPCKCCNKQKKDEKKLCFELQLFFSSQPADQAFLKENSVFGSPQVSGTFNVQDGEVAIFPKNIHGSRYKIYFFFRGIFRNLEAIFVLFFWTSPLILNLAQASHGKSTLGSHLNKYPDVT